MWFHEHPGTPSESKKTAYGPISYYVGLKWHNVWWLQNILDAGCMRIKTTTIHRSLVGGYHIAVAIISIEKQSMRVDGNFFRCELIAKRDKALAINSAVCLKWAWVGTKRCSRHCICFFWNCYLQQRSLGAHGSTTFDILGCLNSIQLPVSTIRTPLTQRRPQCGQCGMVWYWKVVQHYIVDWCILNTYHSLMSWWWCSTRRLVEHLYKLRQSLSTRRTERAATPSSERRHDPVLCVQYSINVSRFDDVSRAASYNYVSIDSQ